jgi:hypothetical protein
VSETDTSSRAPAPCPPFLLSSSPNFNSPPVPSISSGHDPSLDKYQSLQTEKERERGRKSERDRKRRERLILMLSVFVEDFYMRGTEPLLEPLLQRRYMSLCLPQNTCNLEGRER